MTTMSARLTLALGLAIVSAAPSSGQAQDPSVAITVGEVVTLSSAVMGEERKVLVHVPFGYARRPSDRYPVLYLTDGETQFLHTVATVEFLARAARIPPLIVVGVVNTDRTRDLTPTRPQAGSEQAAPANVGGADRFLDFFEKELIPWIETRYRTQPYRLFAGHSFGGLFAVHAFTSRPDLFRAVIAVSPSLHWDGDLPVRRTRALLEGRKELARTFFMALGNEADVQAQWDEMKRILAKGKTRAKGFEWAAVQMKDEDHGSVVLRSHYQGLEKVYEGWRLPALVATGDTLRQVKDHYAKLSERFGYEVVPPEGVVNVAGYGALGRRQTDDAIALFRLNATLYPDSANVHDSLGEALLAAGKKAEARDAFARAVELGTASSDPGLPFFREHLEQAKR